MQVARRYKFRAEHRVVALAAPWSSWHKHDYTVEVVAEAAGSGLVVDTDLLDAAWAELAPLFADQRLNDSVGEPTTVEHLAYYVHRELVRHVPEVREVSVWEDDERWARYRS